MFQVDIGDKDVWDDTQLIQGWNDIVKEYKEHHSSGQIPDGDDAEDEPEVDNESGEAADPEADAVEGIDEADVLTELGSKNEKENVSVVSPLPKRPANDEAEGLNASSKKPKTEASPTIQGPSPWDDLDPSVRELVMAWYWAGYYQGIHAARTKK